MQILIVDDSAGIRETISSALRRAGHICDVAEDGIQALKLALRKRYGMILSDIQMPFMDGLKFINRIRMSGPNVKTPVLVFSSSQTEDTVLSSIKLGIQAYVVKPTNEPLLAEAMSKIFGTIQRIELKSDR